MQPVDHSNALGTQVERYPAAGGNPQRLDAAGVALCNLVEGGSADLAQAVQRGSIAEVEVLNRKLKDFNNPRDFEKQETERRGHEDFNRSRTGRSWGPYLPTSPYFFIAFKSSSRERDS